MFAIMFALLFIQHGLFHVVWKNAKQSVKNKTKKHQAIWCFFVRLNYLIIDGLIFLLYGMRSNEQVGW